MVGDERRDALEIGSGPTATCSQLHVARMPHGSAGSATPSARLRTLDEAQVGSERFGNLRQRCARRTDDSAFDAADLRLEESGLVGQLHLREVVLLAELDHLSSHAVSEGSQETPTGAPESHQRRLSSPVAWTGTESGRRASR